LSSPTVAQAAEEFEIVLILGTWIVAISQFTQPLGGTSPQTELAAGPPERPQQPRSVAPSLPGSGDWVTG